MIPPDANAAFVAAMEDVLETYQKPRDPERSLVCLDETSKQLVIETRKPIPAKPGQPIRYDYEYERNGVANIFITLAAAGGLAQSQGHRPSRRRRLRAGAQELSDVHLPDAKQIVLVQDNLTTHTAASLYAAFPPGGGFAASPSVWSGIIRPNTEAGSTWRNPNLPSRPTNASIAVSPTSQRSQ